MFIRGVKIDKINAPKKPFQKPSILNPGAILATNKNNKVLIIKPNKPRVRKFKGKDISCTNGRIKVFTKPIKTTTNSATKKLET